VNETRVLEGYRSVYVLSFDTTIEMTGIMLDQIVAAGGFIDRVVFQANMMQLEEARQFALSDAVNDALQKITTVLSSLELCVGDIKDIDIGFESLPPVQSNFESDFAFARPVSTPVLGGEGQVRASVTLKVAFYEAPCISTPPIDFTGPLFTGTTQQ